MIERKSITFNYVKKNYPKYVINQDKRIKKQAALLLNHSIKLQKNEKILIEMIGEECSDLAVELAKQAKEIGATTLINKIDYKKLNKLLLSCSEEQIKAYAKGDLE